MSTFDCLSAKTSVLGKHFLEASAGTGKTFAIEHLFVRLLLQGFTLQEILVVTFTKAATYDLKTRLRANIEKIVYSLKKDNEKILFPYLEEYSLKAKREEAILRLEEALFFFERSEIFTIHSFCFQMLKEYSFLLGEFITQEKPSLDPLKEELKKFLLYGIPATVLSNKQLLFLEKRYGEEALSKKLINSFSKNPPKPFSFQELISLWQERLKSCPCFIKEEIEAFFSSNFAYFKMESFCKETLFEELSLFLSMIEKKEAKKEEIEKLLETGFSLCFFFANENRKKKAPQNLALHPAFVFAQEELFPLINKGLDEAILLSTLRAHLTPYLDNIREKKGLFSFDDLIRKMREAIKNRSFVEKLQFRYRAVIIDEFQDTDPLQWAIFGSFLESASAFFLVGDPKQSIYGFRSADLETYFSAEKALGREAKSFLCKNFRSTPSLVASLNSLFSKPFARDWLTHSSREEKIPYLPIEPGLTEDLVSFDSKAPIHFFLHEGVLIGKSWPSLKIEEDSLFGRIATEIIFLQKEAKVPFSAIAILVKDRFQLERIKEFLERRDIPLSSKTLYPLRDTKAFMALKDLFQSVLYEDIKDVKKALIGPFFKEKELLMPKSFFFSLFRDWKEKILLDFPLFVKEFFEATWDNKSLLVRVLEEEREFYHDLIQIFSLFSEYMNEKKRSQQDIMHFFAYVKEIDPEENEKFRREQRQEQGVQIMTTHVSKGLEFSYVFALGSSSRTTIDEKSSLEESEEEKLRQLYVALTRAKKRVYIPVFFDKKHKSLEKGSAAPFELFLAKAVQNEMESLDWIASVDKKKFLTLFASFDKTLFSFEEIPENFLDETKHIKNEKSRELITPKQLFVPDRVKDILSFSSLAKENNEQIFFNSSPTLPTGSEIGLFFHELFEKVIKFSNFEKEKISKIIEEMVEAFSLTKHKNEIEKIVFAAIEEPLLGKNSFALKDVDPKFTAVEMEFFFSHKDREYIKGYIDMLFYHRGKYYLLDWKSNFLDSYAKDSLEKAMKEKEYFLQGALYYEAFSKMGIMKDLTEFGGMFYLFLRGLPNKEGIYHFFPQRALLDEVRV